MKPFKTSSAHWFAIALTVLLFSCKKEDPVEKNTPQPVTELKVGISGFKVTLNPSGYAPLTAVAEFSLDASARAKVTVKGKKNSSANVSGPVIAAATHHSLVILGLYPSHNNEVIISFSDPSGNDLGAYSFRVQTGELSEQLPTVSIETSKWSKIAGMTLVSYLAYKTSNNYHLPFIFDEFGDIRWYLDYGTHPVLQTLNYDNGVERLKNGNFYFGDKVTNTIYEVNMLGEVIDSWPHPGYKFHHKVLEKPNGNFLVTVDKEGLSTIEDFVIEIDRNTKQIITEWDLRSSLQPARKAWTPNTADWIHVNSVDFDPADNCIIVSGRTQGVIKLDAANNVKWILGPHRGWDQSTNGEDLKSKLLKPLDSKGQLITDTAVLDGSINHPDFEWNWYQHSAKVMPNGNLYLFDNGDKRNYSNAEEYSRAVSYKIDAANMTVQQIWHYGKERGSETFSRIVSEVDYHPEVDHFIFSPGAISGQGRRGKIVEISNGSDQVHFEATVTPPATFTGVVTFHRTDRLSLY